MWNRDGEHYLQWGFQVHVDFENAWFSKIEVAALSKGYSNKQIIETWTKFQYLGLTFSYLDKD